MNLAPVRGILTCLLLTLAVPTKADDAPYVEGLHYQRLADVSAAYELGATEGQPSILEMFWYGCGHCYAFDPLLETWVAGKAGTVNFARTPMIWDEATKEHARLFYTTHALGLHEKMHARIFDEIHQQRNYLLDADSIGALFAEFSVDEEEFTKTSRSFGVDAELRRAEGSQRELLIPGVPALIVNGTYLVYATNAVPTYQDMLEVADYLLDKNP